jgi:hypothetical protein
MLIAARLINKRLALYETQKFAASEPHLGPDDCSLHVHLHTLSIISLGPILLLSAYIQNTYLDSILLFPLVCKSLYCVCLIIPIPRVVFFKYLNDHFAYRTGIDVRLL